MNWGLDITQPAEYNAAQSKTKVESKKLQRVIPFDLFLVGNIPWVRLEYLRYTIANVCL